MKISSSIATLLPITLFCGILSGCASLTPPEQETPIVASAPEPILAATEDAEPVVSNEVLPNIALTDEILFKVVSAEIAFQRGDFPAAFATTMAVGQETHDPRLPKRAMEMALIAKQPLQAFLAAQRWHQYSPDSDDATQYYLGFLVMNNELEEVKNMMAPRLASATAKERGILILQIQRLVMRSNNKQASFNLLETLFNPYQDYLETHLALAQAAYASSNSVRALVEAHEALKMNSTSQIAALTLAQVSPSPEDALRVLGDFLQQNPKAQEVRRAYAGMLIEQKQFLPARHQFELLLAEKPKDPGLLYALGVLALQMNDVPNGEKYLNAFVDNVDATTNEQRDPTTAYLYLSQIADDRNDGASAEAWLNKVQSYDGKNAAYFNAQLRHALLIKKYHTIEQAQQFLHELKATPNEQVQLIQLEAEMLRTANRDQEAITLLQKANVTFPNNQDLLYDFAMMAEKLDRVDEMETSLRRVIALNPENQQAYNALGYSLADRNIRLPEARTLIEKALSLAPNDAFIMDSMGWLEFRENKKETALAFLERAYKLRPDVEIAVHVGEVLWVMGDYQKAKAIWKEAQQKDPDNTALKSTLERLKVSL